MLSPNRETVCPLHSRANGRWVKDLKSVMCRRTDCSRYVAAHNLISQMCSMIHEFGRRVEWHKSKNSKFKPRDHILRLHPFPPSLSPSLPFSPSPDLFPVCPPQSFR